MKEYPGKLISKLYRKSQVFWASELKEYNIKPAEYPVLIHLHKKDGITQDELSALLDVDKSRITRVIKSLLVKELIKREKDDKDLRCNRIYLTKKGQDSWLPIQNGMKKWHKITSGNLPDEDIDKVTEVLSRMIENIETYYDEK